MTRFSFVLFSVCFSMFIGLIFAQEDAVNGGTLRGTITDTTPEQNPIRGVDVQIYDQNGVHDFKVKTDTNGEYKCSGIPAGRYLIHIFKRGYGKRLGKPVTIVDGGDHFVPLRMTKKDNAEDRWGVGLIQHIAENIGKRYNLEEQAVEALHRSILEALNVVLEQNNQDVTGFAGTGEEGSIGLIDGLLSHPDCKAAFAKHLTEKQLQDYIAFTKKLRHRDQQAAAQYITAWIDQELSLTLDQRKNLAQLLLDATANEAFPISISLLEIDDILEAVQLVNEKLGISLEGLLTQTQYDIWLGVFAKKAIRGGKGGEAKFQLGEFAAAKLAAHTARFVAAHTALLGPLDKDASQRLSTAIKGVVQQYLEAQDTDPEATYRETAAKLTQAVKAGEMTQKQADERLDALMKELWDENGSIRWREPNGDIIRHPLFQQAIKDVLSEEAFAQYTARQAERENWHQQALRDMVVASLGTQLILDDTQRKQLTTTAAELTVDRLKKDAALDMFYQLLQRTNHEMLSPWQQETLTFMHTGFERQFRK
ncbi:carboxypeptidase regulatory-like domain-containing protein [Candidatus Poribacteria bacterium]|nr:carboxypeptidase regulatory-like domain-containing protein [Candidatus Poribacteria bacterium]